MTSRAPVRDRGAGSSPSLRSAGGLGAAHGDLATTLLKGGMVVVVLGFWLPAMAWGYLTDEHLTAWITQDGLGDAVSRAQEHQGNSPLYFAIVWLVRQVLGGSELVLRLPSVIAVLAAGWHLARLGDELDHRDTGLVAAFLLVANGVVFTRAITARVYGLLLLLLILSVRYLFRYLRTGRLRDGVVWVLFGVASLYMTPFAAVMLVPQAVPLVHSWRARSLPRHDLPKLALVAVAASLPLVPQVLDLLLRSESLVFSRQPSIGSALGFTVPSIVVIATIAGFVIGGFASAPAHDDVRVRFALAWMIIPIVLLFVMGVVGNPVVGVSRYRLGALPGIGLFAGMVMSRLRRPLGYTTAVAALVAISLLQLVHHTNERQGWREATQWAMQQTDGEDSIMAFDYSLIEQLDVDQVQDPEFLGYFTAPTLVYGVDQPVRPLPLGEGEAVDGYLDALFVELTTYDTVALVTKYVSPPPDYRSVFRDRLLELGYAETIGPNQGLVAAIVFRR